MRRRFALVLLLVAPSALALAADAPMLRVGDRWEERVTEGERHVSTYTRVVEGSTTASYGSETFDVLRIRETTRFESGAGGEITASETEKQVRVSDGAFVRSSTTETLANGSTRTSITDARGPCRQLQWPIDVGASWTDACTLDTQVGGETRALEVKFHFSVPRAEPVTVPAGTFDAFVVEVRAPDASGPIASRQWWAPAACGPAKLETYSEVTTTHELTSFVCGEKDTPFPATLALAVTVALALGSKRS